MLGFIEKIGRKIKFITHYGFLSSLELNALDKCNNIIL